MPVKKLIASIASLLGLSAPATQSQGPNFELDYDSMVYLDAENLAEQGIMASYNTIKPKLEGYVDYPSGVKELIDNDAPTYEVICEQSSYRIYGPTLAEGEGQSWGRATVAFFAIVNSQLTNIDIRLYAINGGNDLGGLFLTKAQYSAAIESLPNKTDWPYLPVLEHPWYGQKHE